MYNGIIVVAKDSGMSSHDVVYRLRKITGQKKIGHMGTLDPQARGVLPVCLGSATRLSDLFLKADKQYRAVMRLGICTDTQDMTGEVLSRSDAIPDGEAVRRAVKAFEGQIGQIPPMYSAIKHKGKKLYQLARKGVEIERKPRRVTIHEILIESVERDTVTMLVTCSKGTYIRTLCEDIGKSLGCGGCMESLVRTRSGPFELEEALDLERITQMADRAESEQDKEDAIRSVLIPSDVFFGALPGYCTVPEDDYLLENGNPLLIADMTKVEEIRTGRLRPGTCDLPDDPALKSAIRMYDSKMNFWGVYEKARRKGLYKPWKMFPPI